MIETIEKAIAVYGKDMQLNVAVEELSELIKEICKYKRGADNLENIVEEIADCYIMIEQLISMLDINYSQVYSQMRLKIKRLEDRLKEGG